jgi:hypothetical protein
LQSSTIAGHDAAIGKETPVRLFKLFLCFSVLFLMVVPLFSQQEYVGRYDAFGSYSFLSTPKLNLFERGFNGQFGVNWKTWLAIGGDFSTFNGHASLFPSQLSTQKQAALAPFVTLFPPGYQLFVPYEVRTYTFTAGPQINIRKLKAITFFVRPSIGGLHQGATAHPQDMIQTAVTTGLLGPSLKKSDLVLFYGFGGGMDLNFHKNVSLRLGADLVHTNLFSGLLNGGENNIRFSVGPAFHWGRNVAK